MAPCRDRAGGALVRQPGEPADLPPSRASARPDRLGARARSAGRRLGGDRAAAAGRQHGRRADRRRRGAAGDRRGHAAGRVPRPSGRLVLHALVRARARRRSAGAARPALEAGRAHRRARAELGRRPAAALSAVASRRARDARPARRPLAHAGRARRPRAPDALPPREDDRDRRPDRVRRRRRPDLRGRRPVRRPPSPGPRKVGWHDVATRIEGPAVADVAASFNMRWHEVTGERLAAPSVVRRPPATSRSRSCARCRRRSTRPCRRATSASSSRTSARFASAERFIYLENQFLWSPEIASVLADKIANPPSEDFRLLVLLPVKPNTGVDDTRGVLGELLEADNGAGRVFASAIFARTGTQGRSDLRPLQGRDRRRPLADDRLGEPQRALALQRHRDEHRHPRPRSGPAHTPAALVGASRASGRPGRSATRST